MNPGSGHGWKEGRTSKTVVTPGLVLVLLNSSNLKLWDNIWEKTHSALKPAVYNDVIGEQVCVNVGQMLLWEESPLNQSKHLIRETCHCTCGRTKSGFYVLHEWRHHWYVWTDGSSVWHLGPGWNLRDWFIHLCLPEMQKDSGTFYYMAKTTKNSDFWEIMFQLNFVLQWTEQGETSAASVLCTNESTFTHHLWTKVQNYESGEMSNLQQGFTKPFVHYVWNECLLCLDIAHPCPSVSCGALLENGPALVLKSHQLSILYENQPC